MTIEIIGAIGAQQGGAEGRPLRGPVLDKTYLSTTALAHENAGFDRVLIGYFSSAPDGLLLASYAGQRTTRLKLLVAHRPGFVAPTLAARQLATLDQLVDGRLAVHIITGGADHEQARDGDFLDKARRYLRTDEYIDVLKKTWTSAAPFRHEGDFYRVEDTHASIKPHQKPHIPVFFGGSSDEAIAVAGKQADVYAFWGETLEQSRETVTKVRAAARQHGREKDVRFSLSLRPILGATEEAAWSRARDILARAQAANAHAHAADQRRRSIFSKDGAPPENTGSRRLIEAAAGGAVRDKRLWTEIAGLTGGSGNSTALVGTAEQVADAMLDYWDLGIEVFLIRGFDPLEDAIEYGRDLIPLLRSRTAERPPQRQVA